MIVEANSGAVILNEAARYYYWQGRDALSIKCFFKGDAVYQIEAGQHRVTKGCYLLVNHDQDYSINIDSLTPVESFCIFIPPTLIADALNPHLDQPTSNHQPIDFYERLYPLQDALGQQVMHLRHRLVDMDALELDEMLVTLTDTMIHTHHATVTQVKQLPFARQSTRDEIYRRMYRTRDTMIALMDQSLTLDDLALIACMSPNHFLRSFKIVFHETPHQYLRRHRLERARHLLITTDLPVTDITLQVGFESLTTFSGTFRRVYGASPQSYRQKGDFE